MVITKVVAGKLPPLRRAIAEAKAAAHQLAHYDLRILMEALENYEGEWQLAVYTVLVEATCTTTMGGCTAVISVRFLSWTRCGMRYVEVSVVSTTR